MRETFARMAVLVDEQNASEPGYAADEQGPRAQPVVPGRAGAGVRRAAGAQRLHRARADALAAAGEGRLGGGDGGTRTAVLDDARSEPGATDPTGAGAARSRLRPPGRRRSSSLPFSGSTCSATAAGTPRRSTPPSSPRRAGSSWSATSAASRSHAAGGGPRDARARPELRRAAARRRRARSSGCSCWSRTVAAGTRAPCSPSWSAPRPRAGRRRTVLETGTRQPEAIALYTSAGYTPMAAFGVYRDSPKCRCFAKPVPQERVTSSIRSGAIGPSGEGSPRWRRRGGRRDTHGQPGSGARPT